MGLKRVQYLAILALLFIFNQIPHNVPICAESLKSETTSWWNSSWTYRRRINITENSGYSLVNFPLEIAFEHGRNVKPNGDDVRVIVDNIAIPRYVSDLNITHAKVVFGLNITALATKSVYIYYGNPNATKPDYPLIPLAILEGNTGHAIIDNKVYIGWDFTSWGWSNNVVLWNDFRIDFNGNKNPTDDSDLIRDYGSRQGGIGRQRGGNGDDLKAIGLGSYRGYVQTPIYVDINFTDVKLRVYRNNPWVETTQADFLWMFSPSYTHANYGGGTEQNIVDGKGTNRPELWNVLYIGKNATEGGKENPSWMAFRDDSSGYVFASTGLIIGSDYAYHQAAKEMSDWDRFIEYSNRTRYDPLDPYDQPPECRIYWYGDNSNSYSNVEMMGQIFNNQPSTSMGDEETFPFFFRISASPIKREIAAGSSTTYTLKVTLLNGATQLVTLAVLGLPTGATATFTPSSGYPTFSSTLKIITTTNTPSGTYTLTVVATGKGVANSTTVQLTVKPKIVSFSVSPNPFSPNSDGRKDTSKMKASFTETVSWTLEAKNSTNHVIRKWTGTGKTFEVIWDGKDNEGKTVPDGTYKIVLSGFSPASGFTLASIRTKTVTVDTILPIVSDVSVSPSSFKPSLGETTTISYTLSESCYIMVKIYNPSSKLTRTLQKRSLQTAGSYGIVWDGKNDIGGIVSPGAYTIKLWVEDKAGNRAAPYPITVATTVL